MCSIGVQCFSLEFKEEGFATPRVPHYPLKLRFLELATLSRICVKRFINSILSVSSLLRTETDRQQSTDAGKIFLKISEINICMQMSLKDQK